MFSWKSSVLTRVCVLVIRRSERFSGLGVTSCLLLTFWLREQTSVLEERPCCPASFANCVVESRYLGALEIGKRAMPVLALHKIGIRTRRWWGVRDTLYRPTHFAVDGGRRSSGRLADDRESGTPHRADVFSRNRSRCRSLRDLQRACRVFWFK
jgi:hypothetical protein